MYDSKLDYSKLCHVRAQVYLSGSVKDVVQTLTDAEKDLLKKGVLPQTIEVEFYSDESSGDAFVTGYRPKTEAELEKEKKLDAERKEQRRKDYERLKKEFENG